MRCLLIQEKILKKMFIKTCTFSDKLHTKLVKLAGEMGKEMKGKK